MKNEILLIYPQDETTDFLNGIPEYLFEKHGRDRFHYHRIGHSNKEHRECRELVNSLPKDSFVIFLGHGRSDALLGSFFVERFDFINENDLEVFLNKKVFFLSCRSGELLKNKNINGIGFGHLLTSTSELNDDNLRRKYFYLYDSGGFPDSHAVNQFKEHLVEINSTALCSLISSDIRLNTLFLHLKLLFNKKIADLIHAGDITTIRNQVNLLCDAKWEMRLF